MIELKIMSIRFAPDGLSFWSAGILPGKGDAQNPVADPWSRTSEKFIAFDPGRAVEENVHEAAETIKSALDDDTAFVELYPDTLDTVLVPRELFKEGMERRYLSANNMHLTQGRVTAVADIDSDAVAVISYDPTTVSVVSTVLGLDFAIRSPFSINESHKAKYGIGRKPVTAIYLTPANAYISIYGENSGRALYRDVLVWTSPADILYYLTVIDGKFGLRKSRVYIRGERGAQVSTLLRKYFRKIRCE